MRKVSFTLLLLGLGLNCIYSQSNTHDFLVNDDFKGFLTFCHSNEETAIDLLKNYNIPDTLLGESIWYGEDSPYSKWKDTSNGGVDKNYVSLKLKSFFWILRISDLGLRNHEKNSVCVFKGKNNRVLVDYKILDPKGKSDYLKKILSGDDVQPVTFYYSRLYNNELLLLRHKFKEWFILLEEHGIEYIRRNKLFPLSKNEFEVVQIKIP